MVRSDRSVERHAEDLADIHEAIRLLRESLTSDLRETEDKAKKLRRLLDDVARISGGPPEG